MLELKSGFLRGSYPPLVTPFRQGEVNYDTYASLIEFHARNGSHGIVVNGTTGEPSTLSREERAELVRVAVKTSAGRLPVVAATGSQSFAETVWLTEQAEQAGAEAVLVVTPYYLRPSQRGLVEYFVEVGRRTSLPLLIYHIPGRAAVSMELETVAEIARCLPNLVGMKHAANDLGYASRLLEQFGLEFRLFVGLEELSFPMLALGAAGLMNAVGNILPKEVAALYEAVAADSLNKARALHYQLQELNRAIFWDTNPIPLKYMLKRLGFIPENEHRLPMLPASKELETRLDGVLERAGLLTASIPIAGN
jgi:4-hydroxy-tetrahydrodipicolinate synthase